MKNSGIGRFLRQEAGRLGMKLSGWIIRSGRLRHMKPAFMGLMKLLSRLTIYCRPSMMAICHAWSFFTAMGAIKIQSPII
ncbi:Uncharacterised protein [Mycobacteroides abscessus subsp. abscessus]|nr:Uncharacterised protein [Mycobacteroides abscessus subsp. abscessus]